MRRALLILATVALLTDSPPAAGAPGSAGDRGSPTPNSPATPRRRADDRTGDAVLAQRAIPQSVQLEGVVKSVAGKPLANIRVKLFSNGIMIETAVTDPDGRFRLNANPMSGGNNTSDLWIESPDLELYLDANVLLSAGKTARERGIYPECTPVIKLSSTTTVVEVTMYSRDEKKKAIAESDCLKNGS